MNSPSLVGFAQYLTSGNLLGLGVGAVEHVQVTAMLVVIVVLPEGVEAPFGRELASLAVVARNDKGFFFLATCNYALARPKLKIC